MILGGDIMKRFILIITIIIMLLIAVISLSANHTAFFVSFEGLPPIYYGIGGSYWWGMDLGFEVPDVGPIVFGVPQLYLGPEAYVYMFPSYGTGAIAGVSGQFLLPIESWSFTLFNTVIQPAFAVNANFDYWFTTIYYGTSNLDISISPNVVFITKTDKPGDPKYYGWIWPYPLIIAIGMYR